MPASRYASGKRIVIPKLKYFGWKHRPEKNGALGGVRGRAVLASDQHGQVWIEAVLWISLLMVGSLGYVKLSQLEYRAFRGTLKKHDSRAESG